MSVGSQVIINGGYLGVKEWWSREGVRRCSAGRRRWCVERCVRGACVVYICVHVCYVRE